MKRTLSFLLQYGTLVLFGGLGALLLLYGEKEPHASLTENRMLAGFPELSAGTVKSGDFMSGLEEYLSDNMPERDWLVEQADLLMSRFSLDGPADEEAAENALYEQVMAMAQEDTTDDTPGPATMEAPALTAAPTAGPTPASTFEVEATPVAVSEASPTPESASPEPVSKKDLSAIPSCALTLTEKNGRLRTIYTFSPENIRGMIMTLDAYRAVLPADGRVFFAQPPFPSVANNLINGLCVDWNSDLEATINAYSDEGVCMVNVLDVLRQPLLDGESMYFTTDHHWTPRAACYTANVMLQTMGIDPKPYDSYSFITYRDFFGSAANGPSYRSSHKPDTLEILIPTTPVKGYKISWDRSEEESPLLFYRPSYAAFLGGTQGPWRRFETGVDCGRSCLVIGDSFANCFLPFLTPYYETVHATDLRGSYYDQRHAQWTVSEYIRDNGIDDVYFILSTANGVNTVNLIRTLRDCL